VEGGVEIGDRTRLQWYRFSGFSTALLYEALSFRQAIFVVEQASPYPDLDGLDERAHHLLLWVDGALAGCLRLISDPTETRIRIGRVAVAAPLRGQGFARRLMDAALARIRQDFPDCAVSLSAQTYLVPFYETLGFRPTSPPYDDYGVPHVEMALVKPVFDR
jgi:ElaA protein